MLQARSLGSAGSKVLAFALTVRALETACHVVLYPNVARSLAELGAVGVDQEREMSEGRRIEAQRMVKIEMFRGRREPLLSRRRD